MTLNKRTGVDRRLDPALFDAYAPAEIARRIEAGGITKAEMPVTKILTLSVLAGAYIALGAMFYTVTMTGAGPGLGITRLLGGVAFSLGLILVLIGGAELFTGNVLIVLGWAARKVSTAQLLRNWGLVYVGNLAGGLGMAVMAYGSGFYHMGGDAVGATAVAIADAKTALPFGVAFIRGVLCNILVCMAVWLCFGARNISSKILAIVFPISAFVALGFEHSIANMYFIPFGILVAGEAGGAAETLNTAGFIANLIPVTLGNIVGGGVFVALSYYIIYLQDRK